MNQKGVIVLVVGATLIVVAMFAALYWAWLLIGLNSGQALGAAIITFFLGSSFSYRRGSK